jgi:transposase-like protein
MMTQRNCTGEFGKEQGKIGSGVLSDDGAQLKGLVESVLQEILDTEFLGYIGVLPYERNDRRSDYRNGYKPRSFKTRVGEIHLSLPQTRYEPFKTRLFARYQRSERAFILALQEMVIQGVSTRKVRKITEQLCGTSFSKSMVSKLTTELDEDIQTWLQRPLSGRYPYLIVDAEYEKVREHHKVVSKAVIIIKGIHESGKREILSVRIANSENETTWSDTFLDLKRRGLRNVKLIVSDAHAGLKDAIQRHFQGCQWQRCQFHYMRNVLNKVRKADRKEIKALLDDIYHATDLETAQIRLHNSVDLLNASYPQLSEYIEETGEETLSIYHFPMQHRKRLRTTNSLERFNEEIRRRSRVIRIFPNSQSCLRLVAALCMEMSEEWETGRRYLNMEYLESDGLDFQQSSFATLSRTAGKVILEPILQKI